MPLVFRMKHAECTLSVMSVEERSGPLGYRADGLHESRADRRIWLSRSLEHERTFRFMLAINWAVTEVLARPPRSH